MRTCSFNHNEILYDEGKYLCPLCEAREVIFHLRYYVERLEGRISELREQNTRLKQRLLPESADIVPFLKRRDHEA